MLKAWFSFCVLAAMTLNSVAVFAAGWGDVQGTITFIGEAPENKPVIGVPAGGVCGAKGPIIDESLMVDPKSKGIKNCIIYIKTTPKEINPELLNPAEQEVKFDNNNCVFEPHVLVVQTSQAVRAINSDNCVHNIRTSPFNDKNIAVNPILAPNDKVGVAIKFNATERFPFPVECNMHSWMKAYWLVVDHPYAIVSDKDGKFAIPKLPEGQHTFMIWHERSGVVDRKGHIVTVVNGKVSEMKIEIPAAKF
jgi:plastocyanin